MLVFIQIASLLLWLHSFIWPATSSLLFDNYPMPSYKLISEIFAPNSLFGSLLTFALVLAQAALLVRLNTRFIFINNRTYLPGIIYIFITASIPDLQRLNPVIFSGFFMLISLELMFVAHRKEREAFEFFTASFLVSLGSTFYPFLIFFLPVIWAGLLILRPFYWREWIFTFLGFVLPWFFVFCYYYLVHDEPYRIINDYKHLFEVNYVVPKYSNLIYALGIYIVILILISSQYILKGYGAKKILSRKAFLLFLVMFANTIIVYFLIDQASFELIFLAAIPLSYLLAHYFAFVRSVKWGNIFLFVIMIFLIFIHIKYFGI
jgi:hypothetical protein